MNNTDQLSGTIDRILFENHQTGFYVFLIKTKKFGSITATGTLNAVHAGQEIHIQGTWNFHPKFGRQFVITSYTTTLPSSIVGIKKYLSSGFIKGIGPVYAEKIVDFFGAETLEIIDSDPDKIGEVPGIGPKRVAQIKESWIDQKYIAQIMVFLQEKGVSAAHASRIYKKYKQEAISVLTQNPYKMIEDIWGISFKTADQIAQKMGFATGSSQRIQAGINFYLQQETSQGNVYQELTILKNGVCQLLEIDQELHQSVLKNALVGLYNNDSIKLISYENTHFVGLSSLYNSEKSLSLKVQQILNYPIKKDIDHNLLYQQLQKITNIELNQDQQEGVLKAFATHFSIITGGPGTGKTTMVKALINLLEQNNYLYKLAAPTGRAAKRLHESTKRHASTIHRLLEFDPATMKFVHNEKNSLKTDFLIVDETSMIDLFLAHNLLKAVSLGTHVLFIGDIDQLPSVGPGAVLNDLIASGLIPCTRLTQIFRQAQNSMIIQNAHKINRSEFPSTTIPDCKQDFYLIKLEEAEQTFDAIQKVISTIIKQHHIDIHNVAILTPMNKGACGTQHLNHQMQSLLNPSTQGPSTQSMGTTFKIGDRVMQIRNNYDKKVFNGDIGVIDTINIQDSSMIIIFDGVSVEYFFDELNELTLAYAITIHKSQGSEYEAVIMPIFMQHFMLLQKNLLYTGITRAKKLCIFIGQTKAIALGIHNNKQKKRITFLQQFLTENISCR